MLIFVRELILSGGRTILVLGALSSLFLAVGYLVAPEMLKRMSTTVNRVLTIDEWMFGHRLFVGVLFLLICVILSVTLYFVN